VERRRRTIRGTATTHYPWNGDDMPPAPALNEVLEERRDGHLLNLAFTDSGPRRMAALQLRHADENLEWVTELAGAETEDGLLASVRVHCTAQKTGVEIPAARKPYVVRQLLEELGGGNDAGLVITDTPHSLLEEDLDLAARAMIGTLGNRLPVVYVSRSFDDHYKINLDRLARQLSGMAHVIAEPSRRFSHHLMSRVNGTNAYGGAIGIYWPDGATSLKTFVGEGGQKPTERFIETRVQKALCQSQPTDLPTWMAVRALIARKRVDELRESGTENLDTWMDAFDEENASLREQNEDLREQLTEALARNHNLQAQLHGLQSARGSAAPFSHAEEVDLFPGERDEIIQHAIRLTLEHTEEGSRQRHVLEDLLPGDPTNIREEFADQVKSILQDRMNIGSAEIKALEKLGFGVTDDGKHYKAVFRNDPRYTFMLHKTASDHRGPQNLVSLINRRLFK
jgi:hypothetical protein